MTYAQTGPRTTQAAVEALTDGTGLSLPAVLDALRTCALLTIERQDTEDLVRKHAMSWTPARAPKVDHTKVVQGTVYNFTYPEAEVIYETVFPDVEDTDTLRELIRHVGGQQNTPTKALPEVLTDRFLLDCALVLKRGWSANVEGWSWWTSGDSVTLPLAAEWAARWDLASLTACAQARLTENELLTVCLVEELPNPDAIGTLLALMFPNRTF